MSYILDALRRADSERERGSVPHLHANPAPADRADEDGTVQRPRSWSWVLAALGLVLLGALASQWLWRAGSQPRVVAASPQPSAPMQAASLPAMPSDADARIAAPGPGVVRLEPPREVPPFSADAPVAEPNRPAAALAAAPSVAPAVQAVVPLLKDLPESLRRQLPTLVTGGAMYSDSAANRMLIINGQIYHEGDQLGADLVLERIKLNAAILVFKGQRFVISY